jgi:squalene cyclase
MTDANELQASLLSARNADGGWPFRQGASWTEPTALALLALQSANDSGDARSRAASWLAKRQSADGGWTPCFSVPTSTWVTSLALLALAQEPPYSKCSSGGLRWLSSHIYPDLPVIQSLLQRSFGFSPSQAPGSSPWFPGTAGWVIPTSLSILALSAWSRQTALANVHETVSRAQNYLLSRRCSDGGWNHGGSPQRSENSVSYAETTGLALLALANYSSPSAHLTPALRLAQEFLRQPDSPEGHAWLVMGLAAHGQKIAAPPFAQRLRTNRDLALQLIAFHALRGHNPFLQPVF